MPFRENHPIASCDHGPTRWTVTKTWTWNSVRFAWVQDSHPELQTPMSRRAVACCLDYGPDADEWLVRDWRRQFEESIRAVGSGFAGLPEPIDCFYAPTGGSRQARSILREEQVVVYATEPGRPVTPYRVTDVPSITLLNQQLTTFITGLAEIIKTVHDAGYVMRNVPLPGVTWNNTARGYGIREWLGIAAFGPSNYHVRIGFPSIDPRWTAPECYDPEALLTPATDVYALGKTVLALLGHAVPNQPLLPHVHDAVDAAGRRLGGRLSDRIRRLLLVALHPNPKLRPHDMDQVVGMLFDGPEPPRPPAAPPTPGITPQNSPVKPQPSPRPAPQPIRRSPPRNAPAPRKHPQNAVRKMKRHTPRGGS
jgi:hypothetical protein